MKSSCKLSLESDNKAYEMFSPGDQCNASWEISQVTWQCNFNGLWRESNYGDTISISKKMALSSFDQHKCDWTAQYLENNSFKTDHAFLLTRTIYMYKHIHG